MLLTILLLAADVVLVTAFYITTRKKLGVPNNLSITYYEFEPKLRYFFPIVNVFLCLTGGPVWIYMTCHASEWGRMFIAVPIITCICMMLVAASFDYKRSKGLIRFHYAVAWIACLGIILWLNAVGWRIAWFGLTIMSGFLLAGMYTKTLKSSPLFWLEMSAFYSLSATLLVVTIFQVQI